jgi:TPR repeat protein
MFYYEKAAESSEFNNDWALNNLGYCHYYGRAGEVDYKKAYSCFALSAMSGSPNAMYKLGDMYYYGNYVDKDFATSFYWYASAKQQKTDSDKDYQGFLTASIAMRIGRAFLFGEGTEIDLIHALFELRTAKALFYKQVLIGDEFSRGLLPKTQELIDKVKIEIDKIIGDQ